MLCMVAGAVLGSRFEMTGASEELTGLSLFDRKETIYFWYSEEELSDFIGSAAVAFAEGRDVRVIPKLVDESEYLEAINQATLHTEEGPDAYLVGNDSLGKAYLAGLASEITDQGGICNLSHFPQAALSAVTYHDKLVAYPFYYDTTVLLYNRTYMDQWLQQQGNKVGQEDEDLMEGEAEDGGTDGEGSDGTAGDGTGDMSGDREGDSLEGTEEETDPEALALEQARIGKLLVSGIPQTVDDILYIGDTFDVSEGVDGIMKWDVNNIFYNYWIVGDSMIVGGDAGDDKENVNIYNEETLENLETYKALNQFFSIESDNVSYDSVIQDFLDGKIVFTIATVDVLGRLMEAREEGAFPYLYDLTIMPAMSDRLGSRSMSVTTAVAVNGYSEHKELANEFAAFLAEEYSGALYSWTGHPAAALSADASDEDLAVFKEEYGNSIPLPKMIETSNLWIQLEVLFSKVWNGGDVPELLEELSNQIQMQMSPDGGLG